MRFCSKLCCLFALLLLMAQGAGAQSLLLQPVTLNIQDAPLGEVLQRIGRQGGFSFSYNSRLLDGRRRVSIVALHQRVQDVLDQLLDGRYQYREVSGHIILQPQHEKWYVVSGYVQDAHTGAAIRDASVYERQQLIAANTDDQGYFRLRLRDKYPTASITVSKELYTDTTLVFTAGGGQTYHLPVRPVQPTDMDTVVVRPRNKIADNLFSRLFLSSRQRFQALNIGHFIASRPYQVSLVPGLGTHGSMSGQVINRASFNVLGGYTAGTRGAEVAGLFNLSRTEVQGTQVAGLFNIVGGRTGGVEVAGLYNGLQDSASGVVVAGVANTVQGPAEGVVVAGVVNHIRARSKGTHVAGVANIARGELRGVQITGMVNYARKLTGLQIGLVNMADSTDGYMLGLVNLSRNGYHQVTISTQEVLPLHIALQTGNRHLYTLLMAGCSFGAGNRAFAFGAGLGREFFLGQRWSVTTELTMQYLYLGDWDHARFLYRAAPDLHYRINRYVSFFAGPSLNSYQARVPQGREGYKTAIAPYTPLFRFNDHIQGWIGWHAGVRLF